LDDLGHVDVDASLVAAKGSDTQPPQIRGKGGRPRGFDGRRAKMPSAMAQAFRREGLDWHADFAAAIKAASLKPHNADERKERAWGVERIKLWLKLLPYLITTSSRAKVKTWKGRPSKAAMIALEAMEAVEDKTA
jgi:hypothetical protein